MPDVGPGVWSHGWVPGRLSSSFVSLSGGLMRHEHRAPFIASIVVVLACAGVLTHGMRTDALVGLARLNPLRPIASQLVEPAPVPTEAPRPQAARVLKPAAPPSAEAGATQQAEHEGQGRAGSGAPAQG